MIVPKKKPTFKKVPTFKAMPAYDKASKDPSKRSLSPSIRSPQIKSLQSLTTLKSTLAPINPSLSPHRADEPKSTKRMDQEYLASFKKQKKKEIKLSVKGFSRDRNDIFRH